MMKRLQKYSIFIIVIVCSIGMIWFKNNFQKDYRELSVSQIQKKVENKESFVLTFTNVPASNEQTYLQSLIFVTDVNNNVINMNKYNRDYVSSERKEIYYNTDIYSEEDKIKEIFNDLFKKAKLDEVNFDNIPVTIWVKQGEIFYAGIGETDKETHKLLTDYILKDTKKPDTKNFKFWVDETEDTSESEESSSDTEKESSTTNTEENKTDEKNDDTSNSK